MKLWAAVAACALAAGSAVPFYIEIEFIPAADGSIGSLILHNGGKATRGKRH